MFFYLLMSVMPAAGVVSPEEVTLEFPEARQKAARQILDRIPVERGVTYVANPRYGVKFALSLDYLLPLLREAKHGKSVLEIGCASGEVGALMALMGARRVVLNDIVGEELEVFSSQVAPLLPQKVRDRIELLPGDIFLLLKEKNLEESTFDIVIARNILHLLTNPQRDELLQHMEGLTASQGFIHVSTHCGPEAHMRPFPNCTSFEFYRFSFALAGHVVAQEMGSCQPTEKDQSPLEAIMRTLISARGREEPVCQSAGLTEKQEKESLKFLAQQLKVFGRLAEGRGAPFEVRFQEGIVHFYTPDQLKALFPISRFEVLKSTFINMKTGAETKEWGEEPGAAIIVRKKKVPKTPAPAQRA